MESLKILTGFYQERYISQLVSELAKRGFDAQLEVKYAKSSVKEYLKKNKDCRHVVLMERIGGAEYSAEELAELTDYRQDVNIVVVCMGHRRGTAYMNTLYNAGIINAVFQMDAKTGVSAREVCELLVEGRSRKEAREYYGITTNAFEVGYLDNNAYVQLYREFHASEGPVVNRFVHVCLMMSPSQIADFIKRMPKNERDELAQYKEFHTILEGLRGLGIDVVKIRKPRREKLGLATPLMLEVGDDGLVTKDLAGRKIDITPSKGETENTRESVAKRIVEERPADKKVVVEEAPKPKRKTFMELMSAVAEKTDTVSSEKPKDEPLIEEVVEDSKEENVEVSPVEENAQPVAEEVSLPEEVREENRKEDVIEQSKGSDVIDAPAAGFVDTKEDDVKAVDLGNGEQGKYFGYRELPYQMDDEPLSDEEIYEKISGAYGNDSAGPTFIFVLIFIAIACAIGFLIVNPFGSLIVI